jgi:TPR repeat protein
MGDKMRNWIVLILFLIAGCGDSNDVIRKKAHHAYKTKDYVTALELYTKLAKKGDVSAQLNLGFMYNMGLGVEKNGKEAVVWWTKAAEQGNMSALNNLANSYKYGKDSIPQDYVEAIKWYKKCIGQPDSICFVEFGDMYELGLGVQENQVEAVRLYHMGANQGGESQNKMESKAQAEVHLARMYANGWGVQMDCEKAVRLMTLAANSHTISSDIAKNLLENSTCPGEARSIGHRW